MFELKPLTCGQCGGAIDRRTMRCPYCGTDYQKEYKETVIRFEPVQACVHKIYAAAEIPDELTLHSPEAAQRFAMDKLRQGIAKGLLDYLKLETQYDPLRRCQIIRGQVKVVDPTFSEWEW